MSLNDNLGRLGSRAGQISRASRRLRLLSLSVLIVAAMLVLFRVGNPLGGGDTKRQQPVEGGGGAEGSPGPDGTTRPRLSTPSASTVDRREVGALKDSSDPGTATVVDARTGQVLDDAAVRLDRSVEGQVTYFAECQGYLAKCGTVPVSGNLIVRLEPAARVEFRLAAGGLARDDKDIHAAIRLIPMLDGHSGVVDQAHQARLEEAATAIAELREVDLRGGLSRSAAKVLATIGEDLPSCQASGSLPLRVGSVRSGFWSYAIDESSEVLRPNRVRSFATPGASGVVRSDPSIKSFALQPSVFFLSEGDLHEELLSRDARATLLGLAPWRGSASAYLNIVVRHVARSNGEVRSDAEAALRGDVEGFVFEGLLPGDKVVAGTVRDGNEVTWFGQFVPDLQAGEVRDVGALATERTHVSIGLKLTNGEDARAEVPSSFELLSWGVTVSPRISMDGEARGGGFASAARALDVAGSTAELEIRGLPRDGATLIVDAPRLPEGFSIRGRKSATMRIDGSDLSGGEPLLAEFDFEYVPGFDWERVVVLRGSGETRGSVVHAKGTEGWHTFRGGSVGRLPVGFDGVADYFIRLGVEDAVVAAAVRSRGCQESNRYYSASMNGSQGGPWPRELAPVESIVCRVVVPPGVKAGGSFAVRLRPPGMDSWAGLSVRPRRPREPGAESSVSLALPLGWTVRVGASGEGREIRSTDAGAVLVLHEE